MNSFFSKALLPVRLKHITGLFTLLVVASSLFWLIWVPRTVDDMLQTKETDLQRQVEMVAESIKPFVIGKQITAVHSTLDVLKSKYPDWVEIRLSRPDGRLLYPLTVPSPENVTRTVNRSVLLTQGGLNLAALLVRLDVENDIARVKNTQLKAGAIAGAFILLIVTAFTILLSLIEKANIKLKVLVSRDTLTGLFSRRAMQDTFIDRKRDGDFLILLIDIDYFKSINDVFGHSVGDKLLKKYGDVLLSACGPACFPVRMGGEEFAVIRPWAGWETAKDFASELLNKISIAEIEEHGQRITRTCSIGYAKISSSKHFSDALNLADVLLRESKKAVEIGLLELIHKRWSTYKNLVCFTQKKN